MTSFTPENWFWIVGGDTSRAWSSAEGKYVTSYDESKLTRIASEDELNDVLRPYSLPIPKPTLSDYSGAVQKRIDEVASGRNYADGVALASYKDSTIPQWASEAAAFIAWRDQVWAFVYQKLADVQSGAIPQPTIAELLAMLPASSWPAQ